MAKQEHMFRSVLCKLAPFVWLILPIGLISFIMYVLHDINSMAEGYRLPVACYSIGQEYDAENPWDTYYLWQVRHGRHGNLKSRTDRSFGTMEEATAFSNTYHLKLCK